MSSQEANKQRTVLVVDGGSNSGCSRLDALLVQRLGVDDQRIATLNVLARSIEDEANDKRFGSFPKAHTPPESTTKFRPPNFGRKRKRRR